MFTLTHWLNDAAIQGGLSLMPLLHLMAQRRTGLA
jgi:hypothetical protein